jgi:23S rRNA (pseudouridine1915-N3)-methyltransferase
VRLRIVAAGKVKEPHLRAAVDDYLGRLGRYLPVDEVEVPTGVDAKTQRAIERAIPARFETWALDPEGREPRSAELASWLEQRMGSGAAGIAFVIGGPDGLPAEVLRRATLRLSLSRLTLPHRLARLVLAEQLYRAATIIRGEPYNK